MSTGRVIEDVFNPKPRPFQGMLGRPRGSTDKQRGVFGRTSYKAWKDYGVCSVAR